MRGKAKIVAVVSLLAFSLVGCSDSPAKVVAQFLDGMKTLDLSEVDIPKELFGWPIDVSGMEPQVREMMKVMLGQVTYKIGRTTVSGDKAQVEVQITTVDSVRLIGEVAVKAIPLTLPGPDGAPLDQKAMQIKVNDMLIAAYKDPNAPKTTTGAVIKLSRASGRWDIDMDDTADGEVLANALMGNLLTIIPRAK